MTTTTHALIVSAVMPAARLRFRRRALVCQA
jgi:hypothetical protein